MNIRCPLLTASGMVQVQDHGMATMHRQATQLQYREQQGNSANINARATIALLHHINGIKDMRDGRVLLADHQDGVLRQGLQHARNTQAALYIKALHHLHIVIHMVAVTPAWRL